MPVLRSLSKAVPGVGVGPTNPFGSRILSPLRKPFRHPGICYSSPHAIYEATMGFAPMYSGFADRRVSFFATWPLQSYLTEISSRNPAS